MNAGITLWLERGLASAGPFLTEPNTTQIILLALIWFALPLRWIVEAWAAKQAARITKEADEDERRGR